MTDHIASELRHRALARAAVHSFRTGSISLGGLVNKLDSIWNFLEESELKDKFREHWWTLEQVYAVALDRDELAALPTDAIDDIEEGIQGLEELLG